MNTYRRTPIVLGLSAAMLVAACGGGSAATTGPGGPGATSAVSATQAPGAGTATQAPGGVATVDGCAFLTEADIEAVTGNKVESATGGPQYGIFPAGCEWKLIDSEAMVPPSIGFGVMTAGGRDYYERYFAPFTVEQGLEAIEGLGDAAYEDVASSLVVVVGDTFFNIQYIGGGFGGDDTAVSTELAHKVVARLRG